MTTEQNIEIRKIRASSIFEDLLIAKHFYQLWLDNHVPNRDTNRSIRTQST